MSYTGTEIFGMSIAIIDELSDTGTVSDSQVKEYKNRAPYLLDMWQKEMIKNADTYKTFEKSFFRKQNLLGDLNQFQAIEHTTTDQQYETNQGAYCFFFGVDGPATVYIEEQVNGVWQNASGSFIYDGGSETPFTGLINADTSTDSFRYYKGLLSPTSTNNPMRLRFSGQYYYRHTHRALCPYKFASIDKVPDFTPWIKVVMPDDFKDKAQIIDEFPMWQYSESTNHKWEGNNELYVLFSYEGTVRIKYIPIPAKIASLTQTLELDDVTATSGAYYLAEHFAMADQNDTLAKKCKEKFKELKVDSMVKKPLTPTEIKDVYGVTNIA